MIAIIENKIWENILPDALNFWHPLVEVPK